MRLGLGIARTVAWSGVAALAVVVALVVLPGAIDWQPLKPRLARILEEATGRSASLDGPLSLELLPWPTLVVHTVRLGSPRGTIGPDLLDARRLAVRVSPRALLQGRLEVTRILFDEPRVSIAEDSTGQQGWWLPLLESSAESSSFPLPVTLDRIEIRRGRVLHATGLFDQPLDAREVDLVATLDPSARRVDLRGTGIVNDLPVDYALGFGPETGGQPPVHLALALPGGTARFAGWPGQRSDKDPLRGHVSMQASSLPTFLNSAAQMLRLSAAPLNRAIFGNVRSAGDIVLDRRNLSIKGFEFAMGTDEITGDLAVAMESGVAVSGRLVTPALDADRWITRLRSEPLLAPDAALARTTGSAPFPFRLRLVTEVGALRYRRNTVHDFALAFESSDGTFRVEEARGVLPGNARLSYRAGEEADGPRAARSGAIDLDARDLRQTLKWIGIDVAAVPADRLRTLRLEGRTGPGTGAAQIVDATFSIDGQSGSATADIALAEPAVISARLRMPRLDLDSYRLTEQMLRQMVPAASAEPGVDLEPPLIDIDADVDEVVYRGEPVQAVEAHVAVRGNRLDIRRIGVGDLFGARLEFSGTVEDFATQPRFDLSWIGALPDADRVLDYAGLPRFARGRIGDARVAGRATGTPAEIDLSHFSLSMLDAAFTAAGRVWFGDTLRFEFPSWTMASRDIGKLLAAASGTPPRQLAGVDANGTFRGDGLGVAFRGDVVIDGMKLSGDLTSTLVTHPHVTVALRAREPLRLDRWLPAAPLSGAVHSFHAWSVAQAGRAPPTWPTALKAFDGTFSLSAPALAWGPYALEEFALSANLQRGVLALDRLAGTIAGTAANLSGSIDARTSPVALALNGALQNIDLSRTIAVAHTANDFGTSDLAVALDGRISFEDLALRASGTTPAEMLRTLRGSGRTSGNVRSTVTRGSLSLASFETGIGSLFSREMGFASTILDNFIGPWIATHGTLEITDGVLHLREYLLRGTRATARITGQVDTLQEVLDARIDLTGEPGAGSNNYRMSLKGPLRDPTLAPDAEDRH